MLSLLLPMFAGGSSIVLDCSCSSVAMGMLPLDPAELIGLGRALEAADGLVLKLGGTFVAGPTCKNEISFFLLKCSFELVNNKF